MQRCLSWLATSGESWAEASLGGYHALLNTLAWVVSIAAGFGILFGAVFLMPAITSLIASVFVDDIAEEVERVHYSADRPGTALPMSRALIEGTKTALLALLVYLIALPSLLLAGLGLFVFFFA